jgi:hypothetical protein
MYTVGCQVRIFVIPRKTELTFIFGDFTELSVQYTVEFRGKPRNSEENATRDSGKKYRYRHYPVQDIEMDMGMGMDMGAGMGTGTGTDTSTNMDMAGHGHGRRH